jgi:hypothetical protein
MKRLDLKVHGLIAIAWVSLALGISLKLALLGNEKATLAKQRGSDLQTRTELSYKQERLRAIFDHSASPPALEQVARQIDLPLQPPATFASLEPRP